MRQRHGAFSHGSLGNADATNGMFARPRSALNATHRQCRFAYASICSPCFFTSESSLSAGPLGRLAPVSHF